MALVTNNEQGTRITETSEVKSFLRNIGIDYERWDNIGELGPEASDEEILEFYSDEIETVKQQGGYVTADVINITPETPGLDAMLDKFNKEHWHDDDEVRFIVKGRGLFNFAPENGDVVAVEVEAGDLIRVPSGTRHWFNLCGDRTIRAIRLFKDPAGWTPNYTNSGVDAGFEPLCFGVSYIPPRN